MASLFLPDWLMFSTEEWIGEHASYGTCQDAMAGS